MTVNDISEAGLYWVANGNGWSPYEVYEHPQHGGLHVHAMRHPGVFTLDYIKSEFRYREAVLVRPPDRKPANWWDTEDGPSPVVSRSADIRVEAEFCV